MSAEGEVRLGEGEGEVHIDLPSKKEFLKDLTNENNREYNELLKVVPKGTGLNVEGPRLEMVLDALVTTGVWTEEQRVDFEIHFQEKVAEAITTAFIQIKETKARSKFIIPGR